MNARNEQTLLENWRRLPPQRQTEVEEFVEFLAAKTQKQAAFERLLAIAPALEAAGIAPLSEDEILAEVKAVRAERRARQATDAATNSGAAGS